MSKVAIICKTLLKGGAEKQALILAKSFHENKIDVCFVNLYKTRSDPQNIKFIQENSIEYLPMAGGFIAKLVRLIKIIREKEIKYIFSYLTQANFVAGIARIFNPGLISIGGIRNEKLPLAKFLIEKAIHNCMNDHTIFNNFSAKEKFIKKGFRKDKIIVIQNVIDLERISKRENPFENGILKIVSVGRFVRQKDYHTALNSFKLLLKRNEDKTFEYIIIGYGPLESEIRSLAEELGINDRIRIYINPPDISEILKTCDIFLSTSLFEGVSNSIMEAMAAGLPVVATRVGDNTYLVKDGHNGFLVPVENVESIVEKIEFLSVSGNIRDKFGKNSRAIIEDEFSKKRFTERYISLLRDLKVLNKKGVGITVL